MNAALWWAENRSLDQAVLWIDGFEAALQSLANNPEAWPLAPECDSVHLQIREMTFGLRSRKTHRAIFEVREQEVLVFAVRHLAQDLLSGDDFSI